MVAISVAIVDDHRAVVDALSALLNGTEGLRVVGQATDAARVPALIKSTKPRVLILDVRLGEVSGLDLLPSLKSAHAELKILMLSMYADEAYAFRALQTGADGYVLKQAPPGELVRAIFSVARGERFVGSSLSLERLAEYEERARTLSGDPFDQLTPREREVARLAARGLTSEAIADALKIGRRTVETHRANLARKLGVSNTVELVRLVLRREGWTG